MAFPDLPKQTPINPRADRYGETALALTAAVQARRHVIRDVAYGPDYLQKVDLYLPDRRSAAPMPILLYMHGGGWSHGYKEWTGFGADHLVELPCLYVSVSYRLAPEHRYPVALEDCFEALAAVRRLAPEHGADPNRVAVAGHSAGAHLSAMMVLEREVGARWAADQAAIGACLPVSGTFDFRFPAVLPGSGEQHILQVALAAPEDAWAASPLAHIAGSRVPFHLTWGTEDNDRAKRTGPEFAAALKAQGTPVETLVQDGMDHFQTNLDAYDPASRWVAAARRMLAAL